MSEFLTKEQLLSACKRGYHTVEVDGVGALRIQTLNDLEHSDISAALLDKSGKHDIARLPQMRRIVASKMLVDADGNTLFDTPEEAGNLSPSVVRAVYAKYIELSDGGLSKEVKRQKKG